MYKIMILLNTFSSEISLPVFTKFHVNSAVEMGLRVSLTGHMPLTVMPIYDKKKKNKKKNKNCSNDDPFISFNDRIGKMLHSIYISAVAISIRRVSHGPWASCFLFSRKQKRP